MSQRFRWIISLLVLFGGSACAHDGDLVVRQQLQSQGRVDHVLLNSKGLPSFIRCDLDYSSKGATSRERSWVFLEGNASLFGVTAPHSELQLDTVQTDGYGIAHLKFRQFYQDLPVFPGQLFIHVNSQGHITAVNGTCLENLDVNTHPTISAERAKAIIASDMAAEMRQCEFGPPFLTVAEFKGHRYLAWRAQATLKAKAAGWDYFIDAHSGALLQRYPLVVE